MHLLLDHEMALLVDGRLRFAGAHPRLFELGVGLLEHDAGVFQRLGGLRALDLRLLERARELGDLVLEDGHATLGVRDVVLDRARVALCRDERELTLVRGLTSRFERALRLGDLRTERLVVRETLGDDHVVLADLGRENARFVTRFEHAGRHFVSGAARDATVRKKDGSGARDDRRVGRFFENEARFVDRLDERGVAEETVDERFVLRREGDEIDQASDPFRQAVLAGDALRMERDDRGATELVFRERFEELGAARAVFHYDVVQAATEETGDRLRELLRDVDVLGDEAEERLVLGCEEGFDAVTGAVHAREELFERVEARAAPRELVLRGLERFFALRDVRAQSRELLFGERAFFFGRDLSAGQIFDADLQLTETLSVLVTLLCELCLLGRCALVALRHVRVTALEPGDLRLGAGDRRLGRRARLTRLRDHGLDRRELGGEGLQLLVLERELGGAGLFVLRVRRHLLGDDFAVGVESVSLAGDVLRVRVDLGLTRLQMRDLVPRALDRRFLRPDRIGRGEMRILRGLQDLFGGERDLTRTVELALARGEVGARALEAFAATCDVVGLDFDPRRELEVLVRRLVELEVLDLVFVGDVALGLRRLALERAQVAVDLRHDVADAQ